LPLTKRRAVSSVGAAAVFSVAVALAAWAAMLQVGLGSQGLGAARGLVLIAVGVFAVTLTVWSRLKRDANP
jgi:hypothetical protein